MPIREPFSRRPSAAANDTGNTLHREDAPELCDLDPSLNELSTAYLAILAKGKRTLSESPATEQATEHVAKGDRSSADYQITPRGVVEAILFVGHPTGEPLAGERIAALMRGVEPAEIEALVVELNAEYEALEAPYTIAASATGYQMVLRPEFGPLRDTFHGRIREARLSKAAIDVLAIVGYHQPIAAEEVDRLRGKPSGAILAQLVRRDLVSLHRPEEKKAKPHYRTTGRFLGLLGLEDLSQLPRSQEIDREL